MQQKAPNSGENEPSGEQGSFTRKRKGNTIMHGVHGRQERKLIVLNRYNQPIGPTSAIVIELSSFLGTLARNEMLCPLNIHNWKNMDTKDDLWDYTQEKYNIPDSAKEWALKVIRSARSKYKNNLYINHYKAYDSDDLRMAKKPKDVSESDFKDLLKYWNSEKFKKMSETNTKNRKKLKNPHTAGRTSFAVIRNNLEKEKETPDEVSLKEMFVVTRARKPDRAYKESNEDTISKIAEMDKIHSQQSGDDSQSVDTFTTVMGPEHPGSMRLYGRGVTKTTLKRKGYYDSYFSANEENMQKQMEELEERIHQRMGKKLQQQKINIHKEVSNDILGQLNCMYPGLQLNSNMFAALGAHSLEEANQAFNRPSTSSNNQGGEDDIGDDESIEDLTL